MGCSDNHPTLGTMPGHHMPECFDGVRIQPEARFIQQPEGRVAQKEAGESAASFLACRKKARRQISQRYQAKEVESLI